jgi:Family of unknown function (DUF6428)
LNTIQFVLPNDRLIPAYFHITEMGKKTKHFIDCGNTIRQESVISFQIWHAQDYDHRLSVGKFEKIIAASNPLFGHENLEVEVEYQNDLSIGLFGLELVDGTFRLTPKNTNCLASNHCGIPAEKMKVNLADLNKEKSSCAPNSGCC